MDAIDAAANGAGSVVFITGEGGVGKTRLASAAAGEAVKRGCLVASGRAYPVETGIPYAVFSDAFVPVIKRIDPAALSVLTRGTSAELAHLFPPLASPSGSNAGARIMNGTSTTWLRPPELPPYVFLEAREGSARSVQIRAQTPLGVRS